MRRTRDDHVSEGDFHLTLPIVSEFMPDYEPSFFKGCIEEEVLHSWDVNSKHFVLSLNVRIYK
ncbi:hypothetical protein HanXRQr2_Chr08g0357621 [Helianthus annuus]|uniref:Uncharacterized protein n=1 Tax=Helianthus annuus TaxID=4232 RepID=A0A9K3II52_HELAN|nr:hypothetical protein HanXRQr2_Chr08g0357621 [Helianthus annuus]KAJ0903113.1 hypothetical protein HanPSC8_Chr08g0345261 [Helianthus annuus]